MIYLHTILAQLKNNCKYFIKIFKNRVKIVAFFLKKEYNANILKRKNK
jgi:hypothetical protein